MKMSIPTFQLMTKEELIEYAYILQKKIIMYETIMLRLTIEKKKEATVKKTENIIVEINTIVDENDKQFKSFFNDNFIKEVGAGPVLINTVKSAFIEWKKTEGRKCNLRLPEVYIRMKKHCDISSTDKEFYGIRLMEESDLIALGLPTFQEMP
jgi:hypothetical protein